MADCIRRRGNSTLSPISPIAIGKPCAIIEALFRKTAEGCSPNHGAPVQRCRCKARGEAGGAIRITRLTMNATMNQPKIKRDPEGTRRRILLAAAEEFANGGLFGARVDQIARRAETNERMLYYYFGSKEQLFTAVLEHAFGALTEAERTLELNGIAPVEAITRLAHFVWDYYRDHPSCCVSSITRICTKRAICRSPRASAK